ncbi:GHKL domain-containing protein [Clostridium sp. SHJSY1]|uniref:sensor histidine kinase n=1 Tax=Clostridium sp. SHJSY1 TaxID=2942483 RepID=UPI0028745D0D|nr:GHKL domain-containing protein [Clostridium sp. SHJSY1]MDS0526342.1 GHKL domain-containing protein [Clostridium sp. SHJSY1]
MSSLTFYTLYPLVMTLLISIPISILNIMKSKKFFLIYIVLCYFFMIIFLFKNLTNFAIVIEMILSSFYLYINNKNLTYSLITPVFVFFIIAISDTVTGIFVTKILHFSYIETKSNLNLYFFIGIAILTLTILITKFIKKIYIQIIRNIELPRFSSFYPVMAITSILIFVLLLSYISALRFFIPFVTENFIALYSLSVLFFLLIFIIIIYLAVHYVKLSIKQNFIDKENKQLKDYSNMLENMSTDLRRFKHDYINILSTLGEFINQGDMDNLKEYYKNELLTESTKIINRDKYISLLKNIKITPLKALISSKIIYAQSKGIKTIVEILDEIDKLPIRTFDICRILGIFLDNAIEASLQCDNKFIHLAIIQNDDATIIILINSCLEDTPPVYKIYTKDFSTKGKGRGIGLKSVKDMLNQKYKNILLNTTITNCTFKQEMIMNKSDN